MKFRAAELADLPFLIEIQSQWPTLPQWIADGFRKEIAGSPRSYLAVLEDEEAILGFGGLWIIPPEAQVTTLAIARSRSRRGWGRRLLRHLIGEAVRRGAGTVALEAAADNEPALRLYGSEGFRIVGRRPKLYNGAVDAVLMELSCRRP
jgi:ribosomal protein S18 acetylase RimI-like enzyme